jgi:hypothetical protein
VTTAHVERRLTAGAAPDADALGRARRWLDALLARGEPAGRGLRRGPPASGPFDELEHRMQPTMDSAQANGQAAESGGGEGIGRETRPAGQRGQG